MERMKRVWCVMDNKAGHRSMIRGTQEATFVLAQPPEHIPLSHIIDVAGSLIASDPTQSRKVPGSAV